MRELPKQDPIGVYRRKERGQRRVGVDARCACGEDRPEALVAGREPIVCAACLRTQAGKTTIDRHHLHGVANSPITVPVPVSDHRADLTTAMQDWPAATRDNPDGSPVLAAAASVRGFMDYVIYLFRRSLQWVPEMLEALDRLLRRLLGPTWWRGTELERYAPKS